MLPIDIKTNKFSINMQLTLLILLFAGSIHADDPVVQLPEGKIRGHVLKSFLKDLDYYAFQEIPYAAPPVGENRFKEPKNPVPWDGILNTTNNTKVCVQQQTYLVLNATEDCLYLNVYTPQKQGSDAAPLPVFVYIHGGGYVTGTGAFQQRGPGMFMDYDIVVVTINYRLGPFGFLSTMDGVIPGNLGLKDQRHALRWVNKNIGLFGGDPNKVTIGGESAGAFSVAFQILGENSDGLFRGAIQASGSSMARVSYTDLAPKFAFQLGNILDKNLNEQNSSADLLGVLQKASADDILAGGLQIHNLEDTSLGYLGEISWSPVIENKNDSKDPFITAPMYESYLNGTFHQVPLMSGFNSEEVLFFNNGSDCPFGESYDADPSLFINRKLNIPTENWTEAGTQLLKIYTNTSFSKDRAACVKYSSDVSFQNPIVRQAECTSKFAPVYLYRFAYVGQLGGMIYANGRPVVNGTESVGHAEDLMYTWQALGVTNITQADLLAINRFHTLWANFIKYLNPTPEKEDLLNNVIWPTVNGSNIQFLNFNNTLDIASDPRYFREVDAVFQKYQQAPFVTW